MAGMMELNADVGEGGADALLMPHVSRVSIACGGHVGDVASMRAALMLANRYGIKAGAHPGYPDPANFGRVAVPASSGDIKRWVMEQTLLLKSVADELGLRLFHVKPHGALYNLATVDETAGLAVIAALRELEGMALIALAGSPLVGWARAAGVEVLEEAFADRRYLSNGQLASRALQGAVIEDIPEAVVQALALVSGQPVNCLDGGQLAIRADTLCLHGDGENAAEFAKAIQQALRFT
jgi:5-oxoprolinase (ATP-hydrolysing) subunit A